MRNVLKKKSRRVYTPGTPGVPGSPYVPATGPCCVTQYICTFHMSVEQFGSGYKLTIVNGAATFNLSEVQELDPVLSGVYYFKTLSEAEEARKNIAKTHCAQVTCFQGYPAVPAVAPIPPTPSKISIDANLGWNAGAISAKTFDGDGGVLCKVSAGSSGVVMGLALPNSGTDIESIIHGFLYKSESGGVHVIEKGVLKSNKRSYPAGGILRVQRMSGVVSYWVDNVRVFVSNVQSNGRVALDVSLYSAEDTVYDPAVFECKNLRTSLVSQASVKLSKNLRAKSSAKSSVIAGIRNGSNVDLNAKLSQTVGSKASLFAKLFLQATGD